MQLWNSSNWVLKICGILLNVNLTIGAKKKKKRVTQLTLNQRHGGRMCWSVYDWTTCPFIEVPAKVVFHQSKGSNQKWAEMQGKYMFGCYDKVTWNNSGLSNVEVYFSLKQKEIIKVPGECAYCLSLIQCPQWLLQWSRWEGRHISAL